MINYHFFSATLGVALGIAILILVRRGHLHLSHAVFWLACAVTSLVVGIAPGLSDRIAALFGISYGPTLVILLALSALALRALQADIETTHQEIRIRRLTQRLAMIEADLDSSANAHAPAANPPSAAPAEAAEHGGN
ncbi:MAG: DUF2304 domain-containing protein [Rhodocyclaceae bacterium]|nr:DUF2304 domain-containing protein [Rhodocyclaceae bacterium]